MTKDTPDALLPESYGNFDSQVRVGVLVRVLPPLLILRDD